MFDIGIIFVKHSQQQLIDKFTVASLDSCSYVVKLTIIAALMTLGELNVCCGNKKVISVYLHLNVGSTSSVSE